MENPTFIIEMRVSFFLQGCRSLKEKRGRLAGLRDRFGRTNNLAVCECGFQDVLQRSQWSFVSIAVNKKIAESTVHKVDLYISENLDAQVIDIHREYL